MRLRLLPKLLLLVLLPVFITLAVLSWMSYIEAERALRTQLDTDMALIVGQQSKEYNKFYTDIQGLASMLSSRPEIMNFFTNPEAKAELDPVLGNLLRLYPHIRLVELLKPDGAPLLTQGSVTPFTDYRSTPFLGLLRDGKPAVGVFQKPNSADMLLSVGVPVMGDNKNLGSLIFSVPMEILGAQYSDRIRVGQTGKCFVIDNKGVVLLDPTDKASIGVDISSIEWIRTMLGSPVGVIRYDWNGVDKTCFYQRIEGLNWVLGLGFTDADLFAPVIAMRNKALMMSLGGLLLLALIVFLSANSIVRPLRDLAEFVRQVGNGVMELPERLRADLERNCLRTDELGMLTQGCRTMHQKLQALFVSTEESMQAAKTAAAEAQAATARAEDALLKAEAAKREGIMAATVQMQGIVETLSASAEQLLTRIGQSERGAGEQTTRITETVTAMEEMTATILEMAKNAGAASKVSAETRQKAESGSKVVRRAVVGIEQVQSQSVKLKDDMRQLDENAKAINQIMSVISDIADQTNLLALNAAIEAARAGEAGRGFAVVADEVRKLAEKTMASTTDVGNAIRSIQQAAAQSMAQVDLSGHSIEEATALVIESGSALEAIVALVDDTADQVRAMATASEEQSATTDAINRSVGQVHAIATETSEAMAEASRAVGELGQQVHALSNLIEDMKRG